MANVKFLTGEKAKIDSGIASGTIDSGDLILTSDTDELVFIHPDTEKKIIKSKTQKAYTLNGTDLGALKDGSTIAEGTSIDELLAMITQKEIPATYTKPSISLSKTAGTSGNVEAGTTASITVKSTFTQNDAGVVTGHEILKDSVVVKTDINNSITHSEDVLVGDATVNFTSKATYEEGAIKNNNLGQASPNGHIAAGTVNSSAISLTGKRNAFYGVGIGDLPELNSANIRALNNKKLAPAANTTFNINLAVGDQYAIFAYPATLRDVNQVMYVETNDTGMAPNFDKTVVQVEGANGYTAIDYKVYTYRMAVPAAAAMTFKVTI